MKKLIALLMICLLPLTALAAVKTDAVPPVLNPDSPAAQCLAALESWGWEDASLCLDETGHWLISFSGEEAFAAVRTEDAVMLCCFYKEDDVWEVVFANDYLPFGVDAAGADRQPAYLRFSGDTLTWMVADDTETVEITATYDNWLWYVTGLTKYALVDGAWQLAEQRDEVIAVLAGFTMHQENEPEPVVIEGNKLVSYPQDRIDAHYTVPDGVEIIGEYAFCGNEWLVHVTLPESVRIIEDDAFADCYNLRRVDMPSTLETLGWGAFAQTYVNTTIPEGLTELPNQAFCSAGMEGTVVIPEGVTNIGWECFAFAYGMTDIYLPASLQTIGGQTFQQGAEFWEIWCFNSVDEGETHMTVHAPAGTEAARFARWSGEAYVIEDARGGTDLTAVTGWVQELLDEVLPGAKVSVNEYDFPCVTYSADTVFAFATKERASRYDRDKHFLLCFDRAGDELTLRWINADSGMNVPLEMTLIGDRLYLMLRLGEETAASLIFSGEDFRLSQTSTCVWVKDTGGPPPFWSTMLALPVKDGAPLQTFTTREYAPRENVVQGAVFDGDAVLLPLYDVIQAAVHSYPFISEDHILNVYRFRLGDAVYEMNEPNMTLSLYGTEDPFNLILPAPGSTNFRSEMIDGCWMVDAHTVEVTFDRILGWPIRINIDHGTQTVTVCAE